MRKEMVIRVQTSGEKGASNKAIKVAAGIKGVESVTLAGEDKNLLLVIGVEVDSNRITKKLRKKVGHAEVVELRTVDALAAAADGLVHADHAYRYHPMSPYSYKHGQQHHYYNAAAAAAYPRDHHYYKQHHHAAAAGGGRDYYHGGAGGGYYPPAQYQQHYYQAPPGNVHTVVHHEYANDTDACSIM